MRNSLWSLLTLHYWGKYKAAQYKAGETQGSSLYPLVLMLWLHYFKAPIDEIPQYWSSVLERLRDYYFKSEWFHVYDFIEFVAKFGGESAKDRFAESCNDYLERENAAYRFVNGQIVEITSEEEISEVESAIDNAESYAGVRAHLVTALTLMSNRENPDYRNSIKESISAVESLAKQVVKDGSATLGDVLKTLERSRTLHPALKSAFSALYGYTSDADGIRHALLSEPNLSKTDARFMLICCSAFINYVVDSTRRG